MYEYHRNHATAANDWFNNRDGVDRPKLIRNLFGGRLGGPIVKDRLFFFYNYEGMREAKDAVVPVRTVPSASLGNGVLRFDDNTGQSWSLTPAQINTFLLSGVPVVDVNPAAVALFASAASRYPANDLSVGDGRNTGGFRFNSPAPVKQNMHTARFDWNVTGNQKHMVSFRGNYQQDLTGAAPYLPDTPPTNFWSHPLGLAATHTWLINSNITNRFSYGLTRVAYSDQGDSAEPSITFRSVFSPVGFRRSVTRVNPTHNFSNDMTWVKGNHTLQFGTNIRLIKNTRVNFSKAFDSAVTNFSWSQSNIARNAVREWLRLTTGSTTRDVASGWTTPVQHALVALFGRLNDYRANVNFAIDGSILPANQGIERTFSTEEYDFYGQDSWKLKSNLTLNLGLRYGLSMPVSEKSGYETVPSIPLGKYLENTVTAMAAGQNYREPISIRLAGKANGLDSIYPLDKDNWQPRVSIAWSPGFEGGFLGKVLGTNGKSVFRGGVAITNDYFGQQLAVNWDTNNLLGFSSTAQIPANTFNITTNPGPQFTGPSMNIRSFPNLVLPGNLTFPLNPNFRPPGQGRIERSLDQDLQSPINYSWNFTYGRELPGKIWMDVGYVARLARHLLIGRDAAMFRGDIKDPISGLTFFQAATLLDRHMQSGTPLADIPNVAWFNNMYPAGSLGAAFGCGGIPNCTNSQAIVNSFPSQGDWGYMMVALDSASGRNYFAQGQYDSLATFSTVGSSDYHGGTLSFRQRLAGLIWDFNYTYAKSLDEASGLQTADQFGSAFVLNAFNLRDQRSFSDFDLRHVINFNGLWDLPLGRDKLIGKGMNKFLDGIVGGWQLSSVFRWDSGYPFDGYYDATGWQTNWNIRSYMTRLRPVRTGTHYGLNGPNLFVNPDDAAAAFRTPHPGETGTRNPVRYSGTWNIDVGLAKSFRMPWREGHKITIRADAFNVTNTPFFTGQSVGLLGYTGSAAPPNFGALTEMANSPRVLQFAFRYDF